MSFPMPAPVPNKQFIFDTNEESVEIPTHMVTAIRKLHINIPPKLFCQKALFWAAMSITHVDYQNCRMVFFASRNGGHVTEPAKRFDCPPGDFDPDRKILWENAPDFEIRPHIFKEMKIPLLLMVEKGQYPREHIIRSAIYWFFHLHLKKDSLSSKRHRNLSRWSIGIHSPAQRKILAQT